MGQHFRGYFGHPCARRLQHQLRLRVESVPLDAAVGDVLLFYRFGWQQQSRGRSRCRVPRHDLADAGVDALAISVAPVLTMTDPSRYMLTGVGLMSVRRVKEMPNLTADIETPRRWVGDSALNLWADSRRAS